MNPKVIIGIVVAVVILGGAWMLTSKDDKASQQNTKQDTAMMNANDEASDDAMMAADDAMEKDDAMMVADDAMMEADDAMMAADDAMMAAEGTADDAMMKGGAGSYEVYDASKIAMAKDGKVLLFFKASWCPSCRAVDTDIKASLGDIPAGVTILEVDYDKEKALKQKYGVTTQHTFVQVDASGGEITKWVGSNTLEEVVSKLK